MISTMKADAERGEWRRPTSDRIINTTTKTNAHSTAKVGVERAEQSEARAAPHSWSKHEYQHKDKHDDDLSLSFTG